MTDKELTDFIEHGENGFVEFALTFGDGWAGQAIEIAKELRRLHEVNKELVDALKEVMVWIDNWEPEFTYDPEWADDDIKARAAILKATGEQHG